MDAIDRNIAADRAALAQAEDDQNNVEEILSEMGKKYHDDELFSAPSWVLWAIPIAIVIAFYFLN